MWLRCVLTKKKGWSKMEKRRNFNQQFKTRSLRRTYPGRT